MIVNRSLFHFEFSSDLCRAADKGNGGKGRGSAYVADHGQEGSPQMCFRREDMPVMKMDTVEHFFDDVRKNGKEYPEFTGDLQHHASGCYSVMSRVKRENRRAEDKLIEAEGWSAVSKAVEGQPYPDDFKKAWEGVLFNQFHDIIPGSSIHEGATRFAA